LLCGGEHINHHRRLDALSPGTHRGPTGSILMDTHLDTAPHVGGETINHCCPINARWKLTRRHQPKCVSSGRTADEPESEYAYVRDAA